MLLTIQIAYITQSMSFMSRVGVGVVGVWRVSRKVVAGSRWAMEITIQLIAMYNIGYSDHSLNERPFSKLTIYCDLNTGLFCYSDPHYDYCKNSKFLMGNTHF